MIGPLWKDLRAADFATLLNVFMGIMAIAMAVQGETAIAFHLIFAGLIVDGLDGAIARMGGGGGPLGHTIDALADVVTFVAAPSAGLVAHYGLSAPTTLAAFVFAGAGILRLARFQTLPNLTHFYGLSTPGAALVLGSAVLLGLPVGWVPALALLLGALMVSRWPVPKLRGAIGVGGLFIIATNLALFMAPGELGRYGIMGQLAFTAVYLLGGPAYLKARTNRRVSGGEA